MNAIKHDDRSPLHICDTLSVAQLTEGEWGSLGLFIDDYGKDGGPGGYDFYVVFTISLCALGLTL